MQATALCLFGYGKSPRAASFQQYARIERAGPAPFRLACGPPSLACTWRAWLRKANAASRMPVRALRPTHPPTSHVPHAGARLLKQRQAQLQGTVRLIFQPAEEGGGGGKRMVDQGALDGADAVFGVHVWPGAPSGYIGTKVGPAAEGLFRFCSTAGQACGRWSRAFCVMLCNSVNRTEQQASGRGTRAGCGCDLDRCKTGRGPEEALL